MNCIKRSELEGIRLPGRTIYKCVGADGVSQSGRMTMGFAVYSEESGRMEPHRHAEEICHVLDCRNGWARCEGSDGKLDSIVPLEPGMTLHVREMEWHAFEYGPGGFVSILYFYGQVDNIRPEEMKRQGS